MKKALRRSNRKGFYYKRGAIAAFSPLSLALFEAMEVEPDAARKAAINTCISALVSSGQWDEIDWLHVYAAHDDQAALLNWKDPAVFTGVPVDDPTFTTDYGYTFNGSSQYIDTGWTILDDKVGFSATDASIFAWAADNLSAGFGGSTIIGSRGGVGGDVSWMVCRSAGEAKSEFILAQGGNKIGGDTDLGSPNGLFHTRRVGSDASVYQNGVLILQEADYPTSAVDNQRPLYVAAQNSHGTADSFAPTGILCAGAGAAMDASVFYAIMLAYMQTVEAVP